MESSTQKRAIDRVIVAAIVVGLGISVIFGVGALKGARRMHGARHQALGVSVGELRSWMTVPYIARLFHLPPKALYERAGLPLAGSDHKSLRALNQELYPGQEVDALAKVKEAVTQLVAERAAQSPGMP